MVLDSQPLEAYPLLIFPEPSRASRASLHGGAGRIRLPGARRQAERITPQFQRLREAMEHQRVTVQDNPLGIRPELALVLETVGSVSNFIGAVRRVDGMEWLGESSLTDIQPDDDFQDESRPQRQLNGQLFVTMSDQLALRELQRIFETWHEHPDASFERGLTPLKHVFENLRTIRPWGVEDRLRDTGIIDTWQSDIENDSRTVNFEAELWFRNNRARREQAEAYVRTLVENLEGEIIQRCVIEEIAYHAVLGRIPAARAADIIGQREVRLLQCEDMMYLRPVGQCTVPSWSDDSPAIEAMSSIPTSPAPMAEPIVALFDGLPLAGHHWLQSWLEIDDPDDYEAHYLAEERKHGSGMASLICHGELDNPAEPLSRKLYVRPILKPRRGFNGLFEENIPDDVLPVDLIHRAVRRLYEPEGTQPPAAPSVRIINLSVCDPARPLENGMSSWARLLDWLSYKYNVLFVVSAGNHLHDIVLDVPRDGLTHLSPHDRLKTVVRAIAADTRHRRLLSPAETVNGLTVGADHVDASTPYPNPDLIDPFPLATAQTPAASGMLAGSSQPNGSANLPSTISAHGPGYRRSIKPDISLPGGRQFHREPLLDSRPNALLQVATFTRPPGQLVATPGPQGQLDRTHHTRGTSNAAALASRSANFLYDVIVQLRGRDGANIPLEYDAVLIKALLVHGADWADNKGLYESILMNGENSRTFRDYVSRFLGYGSANVAKAMSCTEQRVSVLGYGRLRDGDGEEFSFPLPPSLSARSEKRRLTVSLAWFSPINSSNQNYRVAHLWFNPANAVAPTRLHADHRAVQRGTVQHEILEGDHAAVFQDGDAIGLKVNCRAVGGKITEPIKYGLAVTLEVAEGIDIPIYQEVRDRLAVRVPINPRGSP